MLCITHSTKTLASGSCPELGKLTFICQSMANAIHGEVCSITQDEYQGDRPKMGSEKFPGLLGNMQAGLPVIQEPNVIKP